MLILECSQGCYAVKIDPVTLTFDLWPSKSIGFPILLRTKYVPSLVKIHWRMLILECSQGCYGRTDGRKKEERKEGQTDGRTDGSVTISLRNFVGEGITKNATMSELVLNFYILLMYYHIRVNRITNLQVLWYVTECSWNKATQYSYGKWRFMIQEKLCKAEQDWFAARGQTETSLKIEGLLSNKTTDKLS
jgi:hypothetical protein